MSNDNAMRRRCLFQDVPSMGQPSIWRPYAIPWTPKPCLSCTFVVVSQGIFRRSLSTLAGVSHLSPHLIVLHLKQFLSISMIYFLSITASWVNPFHPFLFPSLIWGDLFFAPPSWYMYESSMSGLFYWIVLALCMEAMFCLQEGACKATKQPYWGWWTLGRRPAGLR
jgi:hypothetical protein